MRKRVIIMALICALIAALFSGCSNSKPVSKLEQYSGEDMRKALEIAAAVRADGVSPITFECYSAEECEEYVNNSVFLTDVAAVYGIEVTIQAENDYADVPLMIEAFIPVGTIEIAIGTLGYNDNNDWRIIRPGATDNDWSMMALTGTWQRISNSEDVALLCSLTGKYESEGKAGQKPKISSETRKSEAVDVIVVYDSNTNGIRLMTLDGENLLTEMGYYNDTYSNSGGYVGKTDVCLENVSDIGTRIFSVFTRE